MKQKIFTLIAGCLWTTLLSGSLCAQDSPSRNAIASARPGEDAFRSGPMVTTNPVTRSSGDGSGMAINAKATRHFKGQYAEATEEKWFSDKTGVRVCFKQDGFLNRAYYDKKGRWQYTLRFIPESKLPTDVRTVVKRTYFDYSIALIEIVEVPGHKAWLVHIEDATHYKIIRVTDEFEMDVYQEFLKN